MDNVKFARIIPRKIQRRISRLIKIDDILNENTTTSERNESFDDTDSVDDTKFYVEERSNPKPLYHVETNWIKKYIKSIRKDRVKWESILYAEDRLFCNKTKYEQVEEMIDITAEEFAERINELTDDKQDHISKEMIKQLFSIDIVNDFSRSIHVQKVHKPVVAENLAEMFDPELSIEKNILKIRTQNDKAPKIKPKYHAFGRSLSPSSKRVQSVKFIEPEPNAFPEDIKSGENLFKVIEYLKTTKALLKHLDENNMSKPTYLVKMNALNRKSNEMLRHTPLYSFYQ